MDGRDVRLLKTMMIMANAFAHTIMRCKVLMITADFLVTTQDTAAFLDCNVRTIRHGQGASKPADMPLIRYMQIS